MTTKAAERLEEFQEGLRKFSKDWPRTFQPLRARYWQLSPERRELLTHIPHWVNWDLRPRPKGEVLNPPVSELVISDYQSPPEVKDEESGEEDHYFLDSQATEVKGYESGDSWSGSEDSSPEEEEEEEEEEEKKKVLYLSSTDEFSD